MAYQTVTKTSYGSRLKNALQGVVMGFVLIIAATVLLFWNEGRTVKTTKMLKRAQAVCVELPDLSTVNPDFEGKLVHATGFANTEEVLRDQSFGVSAVAIKLRKRVEYYQVIETSHSETRDKVGGGQETITTYEYNPGWSSHPVNSQNFQDPSERNDNFVIMNYEESVNDYQAENVSFGEAYKLSPALIGQMSDWKSVGDIELDPDYVAYLNTEIGKMFNQRLAKEYVHVSGNVVYLGESTSVPQVGDVRITFEKVDPADVSILAVVQGNSFTKHVDPKNGYDLLTLTTGVHSMDEMFTAEHAANKTTAWIIRILGFLMLFWGFKNIFNIITALLKVLPFLGNIANVGVGFVSGVLAAVWWLVVVAIAWLFYRPLLGILLIAAAVALIWLLAKKSAAAKSAAEETPVVETPPTE